MLLQKFKTTILITFVLVVLQGCGQGNNENTILIEVEAHLEIADLYRSQGQFRASVIEVQNAMQLMPNNLDARRLIAEIYMDLGDVKTALSQLNVVDRQSPNEIGTKLLLAETYLRLGEAEDSQSILLDLDLPAGPELNQRNWLLGSTFVALGNLNEAEELFLNVLRSDENHLANLISLSKLGYQEGSLDKVNLYLEQAIESSPDALDLWIWRGQLAMLLEDYSTSELAFLEALDIMSLYDIMTSKRFSTLENILTTLQLQQKNTEALRYSELIAASPQGQFKDSFADAVALFRQGNIQQADETVTALLQSSPDHPKANILLGLAKFNQGDFTEAQQLLSEFVDIENSSAQLLKTLAATHANLNQPEKALAVLETALTIYPSDYSLYAMKGVSQLSLRDFNGGVESLQEAIRLEPEVANIHIALANAFRMIENYPDAIEQINTALELSPNMQEAKATLMNIYAEQGQLETAKKQSQEWLAEAPNSLFNNNIAGYIAGLQEEYQQARQHFTASLALNPNNTSAILSLAKIAIIEEKYDEAKDHYQAALEIETNNTEALVGVLSLGNLSNSAEESISIIEKNIIDHPAEFLPAAILSEYFLQANNLENAVAFAEIAFSRRANALTQSSLRTAYLQQAGLKLQEQNITEAQNLIEKTLAVQANNIDALAAATQFYIQIEDFAKAELHINNLKALVPTSATPHEIEGNYYVSRGDIDSALSAYLQSWGKQINSSLGNKIYEAYLRLNRDLEAIQFLNDWREARPSDGAANLLLALHHQQQNEIEASMNSYEKAYLELPNNLTILNNLALLHQNDNPSRALELSSRAAEIAPENPAILDSYGWILFQQNDVIKARQVLEQALSLDPNNEEVIEHLNAAREN